MNYEKGIKLSKLLKQTLKHLNLTPDDIPENTKSVNSIKQVLNSLLTIVNGIAEIRNEFGTGHGKTANTKSLNSRHAKLVVGAASTLTIFIVETYQENK